MMKKVKLTALQTEQIYIKKYPSKVNKYNKVRFQVLTVASMIFRAFWDVLRIIALMMEAVRTSETLVNINLTTW
jgi:hypothetical protein